MKLKKIPYYLLLLLLAMGASLIIGFLSFTGMYTIVPLIGSAIGAFVLSVGYEGEIYLQNIKGALNKLFFKPDYLKNHLAQKYLLNQFIKDQSPISTPDCPQFFKDYEAQLGLLNKFAHKRLNKKSKAQKKEFEKTLRDMEKWFSLQLFSSAEEKGLSEYEQAMRIWLKAHGQEEQQAALQKRQKIFIALSLFSTLAGFFMSIGTTYLLTEAFAVLPLFATISFTIMPAIIIPMAIIAGVAYCFLIYNAVTDMINDNSFSKWYDNLRKKMKSGIAFSNILKAVLATLLFALTIALTVCTAATWWTVAKNTRPLFDWMSKIPNLIATGIALITGSAQLIFNLQNTSETLKLINRALKEFTQKKDENIWSKMRQDFAEGFHKTLKNENWLQLINPFRLLIILTYAPLRVILFIGHLVSIAASSDRVPGIPEIDSAILGFVSELFEDLHYFLGDLFHSHGFDSKELDTKSLAKDRLNEDHGHDHSNDLPTRGLKAIFMPIRFLATGWNYLSAKIVSRPDKNTLSLKKAWKRQNNQYDKKLEISITVNDKQPSNAWQAHHTVWLINRYIDKHLSKATLDPHHLAPQKIAQLKKLGDDIYRMNEPTQEMIKNRISIEMKEKIYSQHRHNYVLFKQEGQTSTQDFLENQLAKRVTASAAA